jgi:EAL domain-containing protein (putative c-di-GMP-specific phosphodiesterase class I)
MAAKIRVLIADDEPSVREALADLIATEPSLELVGMAEDAGQAAELAVAHRPDIAIVDVKMPGGGGPRATRDIRRTSPRTKVIALSAYGDRGTVLEMLRAGASAYLVKGSSADEILVAIHRTTLGQGSLSAEITGEVIDELAGQLERQEQAAEAQRRQVQRIREVLQEGGPAVVFQSIFNLTNDDVVGREALSRFPGHPARTPDLWFADAAAVGLRVELEIAAVRAAVANAEAMDDTFLALNVSPEALSSVRFLRLLPELPSDHVVVEVTEHAPVEDYETLARSLEQLRAEGIRVAIDDAGAGFASLRHILRLAPDFIKLDISLTRGIDSDQARRALASALISFASEIGATIIAEGIESGAEVEALRALGVVYGQGFHLAWPETIQQSHGQRRHQA